MFYIFKTCPSNLVFGWNFCQDIELFTKNKHSLVLVTHQTPNLQWMGSSPSVSIVADGRSLKTCLDTAADMEFMPESCATRNRFQIYDDWDTRVKVMVADGSTVLTKGQVHVKSVELNGHDSFSRTFHIISGLPCDVIFGEGLLDDLDAFNTCITLRLSQAQVIFRSKF